MTTVLLNETNEDQRNSNAKNNNNEQLFIHSIKRVVIMDVKTQLTIFEHKKKWGGADSTDGVDALVKTFYQFAHSIDKTSGKLERVRFEKPRATRQHFRKTTRQAQSEMVAHSIVKPMEIMEMTVKEYGDIRAIIFVDVTSWVKDVEQVLRKRVDMYLDLLTKQFMEKYKDEMEKKDFRTNIKKISDDIARNKLTGPEKQLELMKMFIEFNIENLVGEKNIDNNNTVANNNNEDNDNITKQESIGDQNPNNGTRSSSATTTSDVVVDDGITLNDINLDEEEK